MTAVSLTQRIKYISDDVDGDVGVLILLGATERETVVKEVNNISDFTRLYKRFRDVEVLDELSR